MQSTTIAFTLHTDVVAEERAKYKIFFRCQAVEWSSNDVANGSNTLWTTEENVDVATSDFLNNVVYPKALEFANCLLSIVSSERVENKIPDTFLIFVDMVA